MSPSPKVDRRPRRGSLALGRVAGVPLRVHWSFAFLVALVVVTAGSTAALVAELVWVVAVFASVVVHEVAHCVVARHRGAVVVDILLLPIGGLSEFDRLPDAPADELAVAAVGPLTSLGLGAGLAVLAVVAGSRMWPPTLFAGAWLARLAWLNVLLGLFNLLPALPMDGGRVLRAALARRRPRPQATELAVRLARLLAIGMVVVGLAVNLWLVLIGVFVFLGAGAEEQQASRPPSVGARHGGAD